MYSAKVEGELEKFCVWLNENCLHRRQDSLAPTGKPEYLFDFHSFLLKIMYLCKGCPVYDTRRLHTHKLSQKSEWLCYGYFVWVKECTSF